MGDTKYSEDVRRRAEQHYANLQKRMGKRVKQIIAGWSLDPNQYASVFTEAMEDNSDRAAAITIFALFDDLLLKVMQEHFDPDIPGGFDSIFHPSAFLGTAHNRLKLALALRWVEKTTYQDINLLRSIRNRFAHHIEAKTFDDARIAGYITSLSENDRDRNELEQVEPRTRFISLSVKIFMTFVIQITPFPYSLILGISSRDILGNYEKFAGEFENCI